MFELNIKGRVFLTDENNLHNEWEKYKATRAERWNHTSARAKDWHRVANGEQLTVAERWELESAGRRAALSGHIPSSVEHMDAQHQFAFYNGYGARNAENTLGNIASYVDGVGLLKTALFAIKTSVTHPTLVTTLIGKTIGGVKTAGTFFAKNLKSTEKWSIKGRLKAADLPHEGKIRYVPPEGHNPTKPLPRGEKNGYIDRFGNEWIKGPSRTLNQEFEWDVQLSDLGKKQFRWVKKNIQHLNISIDGKITH